MRISLVDVDKRLVGPGNDIEQLRVSREIGYPWNFNWLVYEWVNTRAFRPHSADLPNLTHGQRRAAQEALMADLMAADKRIVEASSRTELTNRAARLTTILTQHILAGGYWGLFRWPVNPFSRGQTCVDIVNNALRVIAERPDGANWHNTLHAGWACLNAGLARPAQVIWRSLDEIAEVESELKRVFPGAHPQPRSQLSVKIGLAATYRLLDNTSFELAVREEIAGLDIHYYVGKNRIVESLIETHNLSPTATSANEAIDAFIEMRRESKAHEPTEAVRESCLVAYMLLKYVLKVDPGNTYA